MAANTGGSGSRKNYYSISYGMLSANAKTAPEGYEEISESELKSKRSKGEKVDLRKKFVDKKNGKDYPLRVFYQDIEGQIQSVEKNKYDKGTSLNVTIIDTDGDETVLQAGFYDKAGINFMNRLLSLGKTDSTVYFRPYSIPSEWDAPDGNKVKFFNSGVSVKNGGSQGSKIDVSYNKDNGLPPTKQVENAQGELQTSRVDQANFIWEKLSKIWENGNVIETPNVPVQNNNTPEPQSTSTSAPSSSTVNIPTEDDLPF